MGVGFEWRVLGMHIGLVCLYIVRRGGGKNIAGGFTDYLLGLRGCMYNIETGVKSWRNSY